MSFKLIIDSDTVIQRFALKNIAEVQDAVNSALTAAHAVIQGLLCTTFEKTTHSDVFFLDSYRFPSNPKGLMCCRLVQGFVWENTVVVNSNENSRKLLNTEPEAVLAEDYVVSAVKGNVLVDESYTGCWVKVDYTAGFDTMHPAPDWLQEAVLAYMPHLLGQSPADTAAINAANEAAKMDYTVAAKIIEPFLRNASFQFSPVG